MTYWVGITGGIGTGKSLLVDLFKNKFGVIIIDTDSIAKSITSVNSTTIPILKKTFGEDIFFQDGSLNRLALKNLVFKDIKKKEELESILHPLILKEVNYIKSRNKQNNYGIIDIPLLFEQRDIFLPTVDRVLVIETDIDIRIQRIKLRDKISIHLIKQIIASQASDEERRSIADDIIINNSSIDDLSSKVENMHKFYLNIFKV